MAKVLEQKPTDFSPSVEVAAVYVNVNGKLLLLELSSEKQEKGSFGVPAGKLDKGEDPLKGAKRELFEETGIATEQIEPLGQLYIRKPEMDYIYHVFSVHLSEYPNVHLSSEHSAFVWVSIPQAKQLPLMKGALPALDYYSSKFNLF